MDTVRLIEAIVRQTTILVAQLSTSAGIRAPLAHIADQVFLDLAREIEAQGIGRKVAASMFGMALRGYQRKVQRLIESSSVRERTLWEAIVDQLETKGTATRRELLLRFEPDGEEHVRAVLRDLVTSGIVYATGRGDATIYGLSSLLDQRRVLQATSDGQRRALVWYSIYRAPQGLGDLATALDTDVSELEGVVRTLVSEGLVDTTPEGPLTAATTLSSKRFLVPVGSSQGWEVAVFDHYRAVAAALSHKLRLKTQGDALARHVGGATLVFDLKPGHPMTEEVLGLLERVRGEANAVWRKVSDYNRAHPIYDDERVQVTFYLGQNVDESDEAERRLEADVSRAIDDEQESEA